MKAPKGTFMNRLLSTSQTEQFCACATPALIAVTASAPAAAKALHMLPFISHSPS
jgi:hypothetical protein